MNKKILLTLGTIGTVIAPVAMVVSCGSSDEKKTIDASLIGPSTVKAEKVEALDPIFNVQEDGFYLIKNDYNGQLRENNGANESESSKNIVPIKKNNSYDLAYSTMMGDGDSFYMIYDNDDNDGLNMDNFTDTVFFEDTSFAYDSLKVNVDHFHNITIPGSFSGARLLIKFIESTNHSGNLNAYVGGQNNHATHGYSSAKAFQDGLKNLVDAYADTPEILQSIFSYYGMSMTQNSDGTFMEDTSVVNHASRGFAPVVQKTPIFTFQQVNSRAIKITYHFTDTWRTTAAKMVIKNSQGEYDQYGSFSIGNEDEWKSYRRHADATYAGFKQVSTS